MSPRILLAARRREAHRLGAALMRGCGKTEGRGNPLGQSDQGRESRQRDSSHKRPTRGECRQMPGRRAHRQPIGQEVSKADGPSPKGQRIWKLIPVTVECGWVGGASASDLAESAQDHSGSVGRCLQGSALTRRGPLASLLRCESCRLPCPQVDCAKGPRL